MRDLPKDTIVDGRYSIINRLGSGGMADVYCAQDLQLGRSVALKLLYRRFAEDSDFVERFRREASAAAGLQHPNVVAVYDRGEWDGTYYIAMEYLEGRSLKQVVQAEGPLDPERAIDVVVQILKAARFAHRRGIVHRDMKPHNVIVDDDGRVRVTDFGIARAGASDMTETGSIMGTAQYLSPEQAQGQAVGATSDIYSIGIVLYELLAGRVPFEGDSPVTIALKQVSEAPVPPSAYNTSVPPELDAIVLRALEKDPAARFADADEFIAALEEASTRLAAVPAGQATAAFAAIGHPTDPTALAPAAAVVPPPPLEGEPVVGAFPEEPLAPEEERHRGRAWALILLAILLIGGGIFAFVSTRPERVAVPDVTGSPLDTATTVLQNAGFKVETQRVINTAPRDRILSQDPQPTAKADKGSTVTLKVSDGPPQVSVPDVTDLTQSAAVKALKQAGFRVQLALESSETTAGGRPTRTSPPADARVDKGSKVKLYISSGPPKVSVPDVTGQSQSSAESELGNAGLKVAATERDSTQDPGTVLSQNPGSGAQVARGTTVAIVVAREPRSVAVPDVTGEGSDSAASALSAAGFTVDFQSQTVTNSAQDGKVLSQTPSGATKVKKGSTVTITVGKFKAPNPPVDKPPSTTPTTP